MNRTDAAAPMGAALRLSFAVLTLAASLSAQSLTGRVVSSAGSAPVAGVRVALLQMKVADTTGADGAFELKMASSIADRTHAGAPISFQGDRLQVSLPAAGSVSVDIVSATGALERHVFAGALGAGPHAFSLMGTAAALPSGLHLVRIGTAGRAAYAEWITAAGRSVSLSQPSFAAGAEAAAGSGAGLGKSAAATDTVSLTKSGWFEKRVPMQSLAAQNMGDIAMDQDLIAIKNSINDRYDQFVVGGISKAGLSQDLAMVLKAMIQIESGFNAKAISMYDQQLPCGTHSYGLIQVTPGCERGYATLPAGTPVTATISGGLNGVAATLTYNNPADQASGNTIVEENGIIIDLVTDVNSPMYATSGFNPEYAIDKGAEAIAGVLGEMHSRFGTCTDAQYVAMSLAGYNQGSGTVNGCDSYSANGQAYANSVLSQYRKWCASAGVAAKY